MRNDGNNLYVVEDYRDYAPSFKPSLIVRKLLGHVPSKYTNGLEKIVLQNLAGLNRGHRRQKTLSRKKKVAFTKALGLYYQQWNGTPAYIVLFVDNIEKYTPALALKLPVIREMTIGRILYHEIGHHIHKTLRPEHREREDIADEWKIKLGRQYFRKKYWYLIPLFFLLAGSIKAGKKIHGKFSKKRVKKPGR